MQRTVLFATLGITLGTFAAGAALLAIGRRMGRRASLSLGWRRYAIEVILVAWILVPPAIGGTPHHASLALLAGMATAELAQIAGLARGRSPAFDRCVRLGAAAMSATLVLTSSRWPAWTRPCGDAGALGIVLLAAVPATARVFRPLLLVVPTLSVAALVAIAAPGVELVRVIFLYGVLESADSAAYLVGSAFGRTPLWPRVSPNKTREGTLAGFMAAAVLGGCLSFTHSSRSPVRAVGVALALAFAGLCADLATSAIKRHAGVKDFSSWMPHHGGVVDAYDSLLVVAPLWHLVGAG